MTLRQVSPHSSGGNRARRIGACGALVLIVALSTICWALLTLGLVMLRAVL